MILLSSAWAFAVVLLAWRLWTSEEGEVARRGYVFPCSWLVLAGYFVCVAAVANTPSLSKQWVRLSEPRGDPWPRVNPFAAFIRHHAGPREKVAVIFPYGFLIALKAKVDNVFPFSETVSLILREQVSLAFRELDRNKVEKVFGGISPALAVELHDHGFRLVTRLEEMEFWRRSLAPATQSD